ncbi:zinc-dependent alcohol dehydrogenase family protein [Vitiosangium sp. GDMCC 1.1324]|uniref:zinc-dependent alcohol dehydrogenase family protein n=1 Tax=Vitiosangium sp. (strain GDMCC 1.1324) TaxID=2138576 RepID=UPI000D3A3E3E|nr:zinc-dependent alcohol dehydrogenase family protein [Vitiosangium sp. GDMCC 1.1324]PTL85607.1 alcohol dehydrogenase [Vitiosangium sp. GDMCC 1.1324]
MKAVRFPAFGPPLDVVQVVDEQAGPLAPGEALVEVLATPINPSDLSTIGGRYGVLPKLPAVPGNEGVGRVVDVSGSTAVRPGQHVFLPMGGGTWRTHVKAKAERLLPVPEGADLLQMAMLSINPPTAELLLHEYVELQPGEWVLQNAANSAVGRYLITLARREGYRTVNVVRREDLVPELLALGADVVLVDGPELPSRVREATGGANIRLAIDAVSGSATARLGDSLAMGGVVVNYGAMSGEGPCLSSSAVVFKGVTLRGFWLVHWMGKTPRQEQAALMQRLAQLVSEGVLRAPVDATYPLDKIHEALTRAMEGGRQGKVLLTPAGPVQGGK